MKKFLIPTLLALLFSYKIFAQAFVIDEKSREPISDVTAFSEDKKTFSISDESGKVDLSLFPREGIIVFRHPAFQETKVTRQELEESNYRIYLREKIIKIDEVVVSAHKWEQKMSELPNEILAISPQEITYNNPQTAADILESTGKIFVQKSQLGGGSPMLRGFGANGVLIVVDGVRMNNAIFRSGNLQNVINIDPFMLEGVEVILGPGSVIYGSDALGGVMDFHTVEIDLKDEKPVDVNLNARFASANLEKTVHTDWTIRKKNWGWFSGATVSDFDNLRAGSNQPKAYPDFGKRFYHVERIHGVDSMTRNDNVNVQTPSGYRQWNTLQKLKWQPKETLSLQYTFNISNTSDIPRYDRLIEEDENGRLADAEWYYGPQLWMMNALQLNSFKSTLWDEAKFIIARQDFEESRNDRPFGSRRLRSRTENVKAYTFNWDAHKKTVLNQRLFYGLEYNFNSVESSAAQTDIETGETFPLSTRYPNGGSEVQSAAGYVSMKYDVLPTLSFNAGARYTYYHLKSLFDDESFPFDEIENKNSSINGNMGAVAEISRNFRINILGSTGFRAPNVDDAAKVFDSEPGNVIVPNPNLRPEYSFNLEGGMEWFLSGNLQLRTHIFHSWLKNAMVREDFTFNGQDSIIYDGSLSNVQAYVNTGRAVAYGFDVSLQWEIGGHWALESYFNYTRGKDLETGEAIRHMTPAFGKTSLFYRKGKLKAEFFSRYNGGIAYDDLPPSEKNKPHIYTDAGALSWLTLNLRAGYEISKSWTVNGSIENLLDKHYRTYSSGISAPGVNFIISFQAKF